MKPDYDKTDWTTFDRRSLNPDLPWWIAVPALLLILLAFTGLILALVS